MGKTMHRPRSSSERSQKARRAFACQQIPRMQFQSGLIAGVDRWLGAIRCGVKSNQHPLSWSFPLMSVFGTSVRIHAAFFFWGIVELAASMTSRGSGLLVALAAVYSTLTVLLLREWIRAAVLASTDRSGQHTDRIIVLWPGVASVQAMPTRCELAARHTSIRTSVAGLASGGVVVGVTTGIMLWAGGSSEMLAFPPLQPSLAIEHAGGTHGLLMWAWWMYAASVLVFLINLIPLRPLDAGQLIAEVMHGRRFQNASRIGIGVVLVILVAAAMLFDSTRLLALASFAGVWTALRGRPVKVVETLSPAFQSSADRLELSDVESVPVEGLGQAIVRLRSGGIEHLTLAELAELDQLSAELRDRLHPDSEVFPPANDGTGSQTPIP